MWRATFDESPEREWFFFFQSLPQLELTSLLSFKIAFLFSAVPKLAQSQALALDFLPTLNIQHHSPDLASVSQAF